MHVRGDVDDPRRGCAPQLFLEQMGQQEGSYVVERDGRL